MSAIKMCLVQLSHPAFDDKKIQFGQHLRSKLKLYPGVGKLTVAKDLEKLIVGSKIIHNHVTVLIDPVAAIADRSSPYYDEIRTNLRRYFLDIIATSPATKDSTWIFTDSRSSSSVGSVAAQHYEKAAAKRGFHSSQSY
ncbi:hypothetical protein QBC34DRAFT_424442 [Podospora aff. communis PSN243]|uniref:Uncharacterized protein n=1 Tax=Podospora aff. communis PSN243 TaxID=3040156 RepID=A0AAV9GPF0_9PEZI|nr:hypothetical protein QBC34DRAFT_424442 [Podospora aff. communis PSN243]